MANELKIYMNDPTEGQTDGTAISTDGTQLNPLTVNLDASINETKKVKLAARTDSGFITTKDATITALNDTDDRWKFSLTEDGTYSDTIIISAGIGSVNSIFYAQASSDSLESPKKDVSVKISAKSKVSAV